MLGGRIFACMSLKQKALLVSCCTIAIFLSSLFWDTHKTGRRFVQVQGNDVLSYTAVLSIAGLADSVSRQDSLDFFTIEQKLKKHPYIKDAVVSLGSSDKILITLVERKPVALMKEVTSVSSGRYEMFFVDADTVMIPYLAETRQLDVPIVFIRHRTTDISGALAIVKLVENERKDLLRHIIAIHRNTDDDYVIECDNNCTILFGRITDHQEMKEKLLLMEKVMNADVNSLGRANTKRNQNVASVLMQQKVTADIRFSRRVVLTGQQLF